MLNPEIFIPEENVSIICNDIGMQEPLGKPPNHELTNEHNNQQMGEKNIISC